MGKKFGAWLRHHREAIGLDVATIARETKIKQSLLEALEAGDVSQWPAGLIRRAFVRAYASVIGLDPEDTVREFLVAFPDPAEYDATSAPRLEPLSRPAAMAHQTDATDLLAVAQLCTEFGRVDRPEDLQCLLGEAARILGAKGVVVWVWDGRASALRPLLAHGYADAVLARLRSLRREANNPTAEAFRTARACAVDGTEATNSALVLPMLTPAGCGGALAIEFERRVKLTIAVRALATIVAASLSQLVICEAAEPAAARESA